MALEYVIPEAEVHLSVVLRLQARITLVGSFEVAARRPYALSDMDTCQTWSRADCVLMERGFDVAQLPPEGSDLWLARPAF